jgi:hypothetical protein
VIDIAVFSDVRDDGRRPVVGIICGKRIRRWGGWRWGVGARQI